MLRMHVPTRAVRVDGERGYAGPDEIRDVENEALTRPGRPLTLSETALVKPLTAETVTV
jgi:hypothetical protein